ncbi:acetyl-CoA synthetase-like protein [Meira miltonrushii]|uniref:Acetyl-CoA synthetase-like protein n=1 Tax=Meira miltonrushii TaxID=1280837 RepID=A0A316VGA3_9BASI|nr:acetyl-CoA synthetase-like protein [Meira miltonrushii]PWN34515.1 acetyl-CoA synthetase-like protein [Meira miltonrushii]
MGGTLSKVGTQYDQSTGTYTNTWPAPKIPKQSIIDYLFSSISFDDNRVAFVEHGKTRKSITYGQLKLEGWRLGQGLVKAGFKQGDVIMLCAPNSIEWIILLIASQFAGLTIALASSQYSPKDFKHVYTLTQPKKVFMPLKLSVKKAQARLPINCQIALDDSRGTAIPDMNRMKVSEEEARKAKPRNPTDLESTAILAFSSGTTGMPKAVELSHRNVVSMLTIIRCFPDVHDKPMRVLNTLPFFHAMALQLHIFLPIAVGSTVHIQVPFNPQLFLKLIAQEQIQSTVLVPPIAVAFANHPAVTKELFSSMITFGCGGAPLDTKVQVKLAEKIQTDVAQGWGMTETTVGCLGIHSKMSPGTCGRVLPGIELKLIDPESGSPVEPGKRGEIWVRGPNIFKGYHKNPKATEETMTPDGFLKTGDIAYANEEGHFAIVDRIKELIKYKGNQVAPAELEGLINRHPKVALSGVVGIYSEQQGTELPRAYIQLKPNTPKQGVEKEIEEYVKANASNPKWLRGGVSIIPAIPATPSGKLLRKELRVLAKKEMQKFEGDPPQARL